MAGITSGTHKRQLLCFTVQPASRNRLIPGPETRRGNRTRYLFHVRAPLDGFRMNQKEKKKSSVGAVAIPLVENVPNVLLKKSSATSGVHVISTIHTYISLVRREKDLCILCMYVCMIYIIHSIRMHPFRLAYRYHMYVCTSSCFCVPTGLFLHTRNHDKGWW